MYLLLMKRTTCAVFLGDVELLANWGPIMFLIFMPIVMWEMDSKGLRLPSVLSSFAVALGTGLRCLPLEPNVLK